MANTPTLAKTPATIITGFLGSGKTSLLRHIINNAEGRRLAIIVNEFGEIGVDGALLESCASPCCAAEDIVELRNGCICCTVADDFLPTLEMLLNSGDKRPDHILIETSGLALPEPLVRAFQWPEVRARATVDGIITVVDGPAAAAGLFAHDPAAVEIQRRADASLDHENPLHELFEDQTLCADLVVLNKADLMDPETVARARHEIEHVRPDVRVLPAERGALPVDVLLGIAGRAEETIDERMGDHSHDHDHGDHSHDDFESLSCPIPDCASPEAARDLALSILAMPGVLRVKGFAAITGKAARLAVQGVGQRCETFFDRPWSALSSETVAPQEHLPQGHLIVIGLAAEMSKPDIMAALSSSQ